MGMLGQGGLDGIWDNPMVANIAFRPSQEEPSHLGATSGPIRDGTFAVGDGHKVSYRLYVPADVSSVRSVVYFFHGNAEVCTQSDDFADFFHCHGAALLSIDYRGYAWGTGTPSLTKLCDDASHCFIASQAVLEAAGIGGKRCVLHGRSIGATCAVHLAARFGSKVHGLVVDSGLMSLKQLPTVQMLGPMIFAQNPQMFTMLQEPFDTLGKLANVSCPTLIMHGDQDEIVPFTQASQCLEKCAAPKKHIKCWNGGTHNDILLKFASGWKEEIVALLKDASEFECAFPAAALVELHSLSSAEFNGLRGRVIGPAAPDRIRVQLADCEKSLKPDNLKRIAEPCLSDFACGMEVKAHSLSAAALNGIVGSVTGVRGDRIVVQFPDPHGEKALKPGNLQATE